MLREKVVFVIIEVRILTLINIFRRKDMSLLYIAFDILLIGYIFIVGIGKQTLIIRLALEVHRLFGL